MSVEILCDSCNKEMRRGDEIYCEECKAAWVQDYEDQLAALEAKVAELEEEISDLEEQVSSKVETKES
jgi:cell division protein FtsB